jgi:SAM-dependent methyltransferase
MKEINKYKERPSFDDIIFEVDSFLSCKEKYSVMPLFLEEQPATWLFLKKYIDLFMKPTGLNKKVLDVGCGSGFWAILFKKKYPDSEVYAIDKNPKAIEKTKINIHHNFKNNETEEQNVIHLTEGNYSKEKYLEKQFDLIILTPPYHLFYPKNEDKIPLFANGRDYGYTEFYEQLRIAKQHLREGGVILYNHMCLGNEKEPAYIGEINNIFENTGTLRYVNIVKPIPSRYFLDSLYPDNEIPTEEKQWKKEITDKFSHIYYTSGFFHKLNKNYETEIITPEWDKIQEKYSLEEKDFIWEDRIDLHREINSFNPVIPIESLPRKEINLSLATSEQNIEECYILSGSCEFKDIIIECLKTINQQGDSFMIDFSTIASSIGRNCLADFITIINQDKDFGDYPTENNLCSLAKSYNTIYEPLQKRGLGVYYHPDFFSKPAIPQIIFSKDANLLDINEIIEEINKNQEPNNNENQGPKFQNIEDNIIFSNISFPFSYEKFVEYAQNNRYSVKTRCHILHKLFDTHFKKTNKDSLLVCIPIVAYPYDKNIKYQGLGAVFIYIITSNIAIYGVPFIKKLSKEVELFAKNLTYYYSFGEAKALAESSKTNAIKSAVAAIMSRNMSHNLGSHVISGTKNYLITNNFEGIDNGAAKGVYRLNQYLQERMDFISVVINSAHNGYSFYAPLNLKADILDEIAADGREKRHGPSNGGKITRSFLLDNIVKSEGIYRQYGTELYDEKEIPIEIMLLKKEKKENGEDVIKSFTSESNGDNNANDFNDINFSIPFGINSRHAFLTILENYIRNSAKHNREYPVKTLLITVMVEEAPNDDYKITVFDNKAITDDKLTELKMILQDNINILKNNSLDTYYKGFKEMLICSAWLKNKYQDWSIIESHHEKQKDLLSFEHIPLNDIKQSVLKHIANEEQKLTNGIADNYKTKLTERKKKIENYTDVNAFGVEFYLPKHQFLHCKEITDVKEAYDFPSADFYAVKANKELHAAIENILPKVFFVDNIDDLKNKGLAETKDFIISNCKEKYLKEYAETSIITYYSSHPTGDWKEENVIRVKHNEKDVNTSSLPPANGKNICLFSRHNDTPSVFDDTFEPFKSKYGDKLRFLEGISGGSYNYNLLVNALLDELDELKIAHSCYSKIAIIDERIHKKYGSWKIGNENFDVTTANRFNEELKLFRNGEKSELSADCRTYLTKHIGKGNRSVGVSERDKWIADGNVIAPPKIISDLLGGKNIYVYDCTVEKRTDGMGKELNVVVLVDLNGTKMDKLPEKMDFISTHYGIIQKLPPYNNKIDIKSKYSGFLNDIAGESNPKVAIHSGRGGVMEQQEEITFIPLSTIEAQLEDCKYKLAQLFFNLKYKPVK